MTKPKRLSADELETAWTPDVFSDWPDEPGIRGHIAALEADLTQWMRDYGELMDKVDSVYGKLDVAHAENAKLREALELVSRQMTQREVWGTGNCWLGTMYTLGKEAVEAVQKALAKGKA